MLKRSSMCSSIASSLSGFTRLKNHRKRISVLYILIWKQWLASSRTQLWVKKPAHFQTCYEAFAEWAEWEKHRHYPTPPIPLVAVVIFGVGPKISKVNHTAGKPKSSFGVCQLLEIFQIVPLAGLRVPYSIFTQHALWNDACEAF